MQTRCVFQKRGFMSWSRLIGQFGGLFKLFPGCIYAASLLLSIAGAKQLRGRPSRWQHPGGCRQQVCLR